jgi:hypothetical protein
MRQPGDHDLPHTQPEPVAVARPASIKLCVVLEFLGHHMDQKWNIVNSFVGYLGNGLHAPSLPQQSGIRQEI